MYMCLTCDACRRLEVWGSRKGHGGHSEGVHLSWRLHRRCVLCWWGEVDLIVKVVLKLLHGQKKGGEILLRTKKKTRCDTTTG